MPRMEHRSALKIVCNGNVTTLSCLMPLRYFLWHFVADSIHYLCITSTQSMFDLFSLFFLIYLLIWTRQMGLDPLYIEDVRIVPHNFSGAPPSDLLCVSQIFQTETSALILLSLRKSSHSGLWIQLHVFVLVWCRFLVLNERLFFIDSIDRREVCVWSSACYAPSRQQGLITLRCFEMEFLSWLIDWLDGWIVWLDQILHCWAASSSLPPSSHRELTTCSEMIEVTNGLLSLHTTHVLNKRAKVNKQAYNHSLFTQYFHFISLFTFVGTPRKSRPFKNQCFCACEFWINYLPDGTASADSFPTAHRPHAGEKSAQLIFISSATFQWNWFIVNLQEPNPTAENIEQIVRESSSLANKQPLPEHLYRWQPTTHDNAIRE
jgi:hypothetical protein